MNNAVVQSDLIVCLLSPLAIGLHIWLFRNRGANTGAYVHLLPMATAHMTVWLAVMLPFGVPSLAQFIAAVSLVGFICLSYAQAFSLATRGFSLRILVDIREHGPRTIEQVMSGYSGGRGLDWMYEKRLLALESVGLIYREGDMVIAKPAGRFAGLMGVYVKRILNMGAGG